MGGIDLPHGAVREQIASAIHVVIHQERTPDGRRRIAAVQRVRRDGISWRLEQWERSP